MISLNDLTKNLVIDKFQGYAIYFHENGKTIGKVNGKVSTENSDDITYHTNFRLASVTKQFIAYGIVSLVKENKLSYDTTIKSIFNDLPDYFNNITVKNLLNHTSGIYNYENMAHKDDDPQVRDEDILPYLKNTSNTYFLPGTKYKYSNTGYILLGLIISKVTGRTLKDYIENEIFAKAGMTNSKVNIQGETEIKDRAYGHEFDENHNLVVRDQYWCSATIGDGGLYSSIDDLKKWVKFLANSENFEDMKKANYVGKDEYNEYGLGIRNINVKGHEIIYHCGNTIGTNTLVLFSKELKICLIFLTNFGDLDTGIMKDKLVNYLEEHLK